MTAHPAAGLARAIPRSAHALPLLFGDEHRALAARLSALAPRFADLHDTAATVAALRETDLFAHLIAGEQTGRIDTRALLLVREMLGYVCPLADAIFAVQGLGARPLQLEGDAAQRAFVHSQVRPGKAILGFALTEPDAGSDVSALATTARRVASGADGHEGDGSALAATARRVASGADGHEGDGFVLDGEKHLISNVGIATHYVVFANADPALGRKGISAFLVPRDAPGLVERKMTMSVDHPIGALSFRACRVPAAALVGRVGGGFSLAMRTLNDFRATVGAAAAGMAERALDETVAHVKARRQFGRPLGDHQLVQGYLAEMATDLAASRLLVAHAAAALDAGGDGGRVEVAMAKMFATEAAQTIIDKAVQLHGGLGVTSGSVVERLYREIRPLRIYEGTTEIQKLIIARELLA